MLGFFRQVYQRAVSGIVNYRGVIRAVSEMGVRHRLLGNGMGVVGAAASMGFSCDSGRPHLRADRVPQARELRDAQGRRAPVGDRDGGRDLPSHLQQLRPRVRAGARRPDRSQTPSSRGSGGTLLGPCSRPSEGSGSGEEALGHIVYATNQCTDAHLRSRLSMPLKAFSAGWLEGVVASSSPPRAAT